MGITNILLVADSAEAAAVAQSEDPSQAWDGLSYRGLDRIELATLWALVESGSADDRFDERLEQIVTVPEGEKGPWVDVVPANMLSTLASIAAMEGKARASLAEAWSRTEEFDGWEQAEVADLLQGIGDMAETATLQGKTLLLWTSL
jgi:hypothetical protein